MFTHVALTSRSRRSFLTARASYSCTFDPNATFKHNTGVPVRTTGLEQRNSPSVQRPHTSAAVENHRMSNSFSIGPTLFLTGFNPLPLSSTSINEGLPASPAWSFLLTRRFTTKAVAGRLNSRAISCNHFSSLSYGR